MKNKDDIYLSLTHAQQQKAIEYINELTQKERKSTQEAIAFVAQLIREHKINLD